MDPRPIGVFDSGLGGLTAVRQLRRVLPGEDIVYFGDTGRVPYGTRGVDVIVRYAKQDIAFLLEQNVKYVMAACGTVSSTLSEAYTRTLPVPYTGVVQSAAAAAVRATRTGLIGVIGTLLGYVFGLSLGWLLKRYQFIKLPENVYTLDHLPIIITVSDVLIVGASAMLLCFLATLYPARQAARLEPAEALRYE